MKETLEEAAEKVYPNDGFKDEIWADIGEVFREKFIEGAKWQQERMYGEEDLREAFKQSRQAKIFEKDMPPVYENFEQWFEQFKK